MIEREATQISSNAEDFLSKDPTIFDDDQDPYKTLANVIDDFHKAAEDLEIIPTIRSEIEENPFYCYKFTDPSEPNLKIFVYTPVHDKRSVINDMDFENTWAKFKWKKPIKMYTKIKPLENEEDKGDYLELLQLIVADRLVDIKKT